MENIWLRRYNIVYANLNPGFIQIKQPSSSRSIFSHLPQLRRINKRALLSKAPDLSGLLD